MTIREALNFAIKKLKNGTSSALDAEVLLSHILDKPKEYLLMNSEKVLMPSQEKQFKIFLDRRVTGWPVAYLTEKKEFLGLNFKVNKNVLIPRVETEELAELVIKKTKSLRSVSVLDIGTGSGAIVISLAKNLPLGKFFASDISRPALAVAKQNAKTNQAKITFKHGDLLAPWKKERFDIIVANLPYLAQETDVSTKFEPKRALIAKKQGLELIEKLLRQISALSPLPSALFLEIGHDQGGKIKNLANAFLPDYETKILKDLSGRTRFAVLDLNYI